MKVTLILAILFVSFTGLSQEVKQVSGLESYQGELNPWGQKKGKITQA